MSPSTRVLLSIDDDETLSFIIQTTLKLTVGWTVITANSGHDGLRKAVTQPLDAILLDVEMPELDGVETLYALRMNPATLYIPVVFLTGSHERITSLSQRHLGINGIIDKPFDPMLLASQIAIILGWSER